MEILFKNNEQLKKISLFTLNNSSRNPALWVKFDPDQEFLHQIHLTQTENILLLQLTREKDGRSLYRILQSLVIILI